MSCVAGMFRFVSSQPVRLSSLAMTVAAGSVLAFADAATALELSDSALTVQV